MHAIHNYDDNFVELSDTVLDQKVVYCQLIQ